MLLEFCFTFDFFVCRLHGTSFLGCFEMRCAGRLPTEFSVTLFRTEQLCQHILLALMWWWWFDPLPVRSRTDLFFHLSFSSRLAVTDVTGLLWSKSMTGRNRIWPRWCCPSLTLLCVLSALYPAGAGEMPQSLGPGPQRVKHGILTFSSHQFVPSNSFQYPSVKKNEDASYSESSHMWGR